MIESKANAKFVIDAQRIEWIDFSARRKVIVPTATLALKVFTAALTEQLARDADTTTIIRTVIALSGVIVRYAPNETVRAVADGLRVRALKLSLANEIPRFVVRDMLDDFIQQLESRPDCPRV